MLLQARDRDVNVSRSALGSADPAAVLALNESMYAAGAVLLYARIHGLPPTAPFIRRQTQIIVDEVSKIPVDSRVSFAIVFPLFIAGCEAMEQMMRDAIVQRLRDPGGVTYRSRARAPVAALGEESGATVSNQLSDVVVPVAIYDTARVVQVARSN
ncbi:hypothetical protein HYQ46_003687 [Verticillium longisporum]|nr:hypothetical protein HYQ46_003687 [Verticillium longisporum]